MAVNEAPSMLAGRYVLGGLLGRGGMGDVRSARDQVLDRPVAVKFLREDVAATASARRRFEAEARAAAQLVHPRIVQVFDSGEDDGVPFIVMERLPGRSFQDDLAGAPLPLERVSAMAAQVLEALGAAHSAGLVHRDIKPGNILETSDGSWKVADFGIAKSVQPDSSDETVTGLVLGTPAYLPPERLFGGAATASGDLYSLGVIMYEALAGRRPFDAATPEGWASAVAGPAAPLAQHRPDLPPSLAAVVDRSISRNPADRFQSAREMADALRGEGPAEDAPGWWAVAPAAPVAGAAEYESTRAFAAAPWPTQVQPVQPVPGGAPAGAARSLRRPAALAGIAGIAGIAGVAAAARRRWAALAAGAIGILLVVLLGVSAFGSSGRVPAVHAQTPSTTVAPTTMVTTPPSSAPAPPRPRGGGPGGDGGGHGGPGGGHGG